MGHDSGGQLKLGESQKSHEPKRQWQNLVWKKTASFLLFSAYSGVWCLKQLLKWNVRGMRDEWKNTLIYTSTITWIDIQRLESNTRICCSVYKYVLIYTICDYYMFAYIPFKDGEEEKKWMNYKKRKTSFSGYHFQRHRTMCIIPTAERDVRLRIYFVCVFRLLYHTNRHTLSLTSTHFHYIHAHGKYTSSHSPQVFCYRWKTNSVFHIMYTDDLKLMQSSMTNATWKSTRPAEIPCEKRERENNWQREIVCANEMARQFTILSTY